jgi:predicted metal-dependent peptidase
MAVTKLDKAKVSIVTQQPFFASILMKRQIQIDMSIPTAAVDQRGQIYLNPEFAEGLSVEQLVFLLCHEVGHVIGQHALRRGARTPGKWNKAGDAWINDMLKAAQIGDFIEGGVDMPGSKDETVDVIYNKLPDDPDGGGPGGIGNDLIERGGPVGPDEANRIDAETRVEVAQAAQAAKAQGKMPAALSKIIADLIDPGTPWYDILERYMVAFTKGDYTWSRPNRRFGDVYLPSVGQVAQMGEVVLQIDVSGSISQKELAYYNGHMARILEMCQPSRVHAIYVDTNVCKHDIFEQGEEVKLEFYSGGGTDMEEGFRYIEKEGIDAEVIVVMTDGYTGFQPTNPISVPVVWCISSDVVAPYGETVHFELEPA